ncbi:hypothetical protein LguiA_001155 [Lonicera macranthoides]
MKRKTLDGSDCDSPDMSNLPDEIIEQILVRLPAKSLLRFNLVCKQWLSLISNPNFVRKHLDYVLSLDINDESNSSNHHHRKLIVNSSPNLYSIDYYYEETLNSFTSTKLDFPFQHPHGLHIFASCNGLLLIGSDDTFVLWNPLLRDYNNLPECSSFSIPGYLRLLGFGYQSSLDDYKIVIVTTSSAHFEPMRNVRQKVEIYSLKTNSWKTIQGGVPYGNVSIFNDIEWGTPVNGSIYWVVTDADYDEDDDDDSDVVDNWIDVVDNWILAFDLIDEKFRLVGTPVDDDVQPKWVCNLVEVRGCLGLYQTTYNLRDVMLWILKEDENKNGYWNKLMRIPKDFGIYSFPVFFMKNDEVLLIVSSDKSFMKDKKLVLYNPKHMRFRNLPTCGTSVWSDDWMYVETLVSPNGGRGRQ